MIVILISYYTTTINLLVWIIMIMINLLWITIIMTRINLLWINIIMSHDQDQPAGECQRQKVPDESFGSFHHLNCCCCCSAQTWLTLVRMLLGMVSLHRNDWMIAMLFEMLLGSNLIGET